MLGDKPQDQLPRRITGPRRRADHRQVTPTRNLMYFRFRTRLPEGVAKDHGLGSSQRNLVLDSRQQQERRLGPVHVFERGSLPALFRVAENEMEESAGTRVAHVV